MDSMLKPKLPDDPHDILVVAPDAVRVAPADEASDPIRDLMRGTPSAPQIHPGSDFSAGAAVPPVDTNFRPTAVNDVMAPRRGSFGRRALRAVTALLLTACIGGAAVAWQHHGAAAERLIAEWAPLFARSTAQPAEKVLAAQPTLAAAQADTTSASTPPPAAQPQPVAETAPPTAAAAPPDQPPSMETMARDLANAGQEIEQLKASIEQLKASQQQLVAMVSEKNSAQAVRAKRPPQPAPPPRPVAALAPARKPPPLPPPPSLPPRPATAAPLQTAPAPYVPRRAEQLPPTTAETLDDPELPYVPRPPMPLR